MENKLLVSPSPHIHSTVSTKSLMLDVLLALSPAVLLSIIFYGSSALFVLLTSIFSCLSLEWVINKYLLKKESTIGDLSALVTAVLLALSLPPSIPLWIVFIGAVVAIGIVKMTFGGLGQNIFNPAIAARVFLLISFPSQMSYWETPKGLWSMDAFSGATPLSLIKEGLSSGCTVSELMQGAGYSYSSIIFANLGGSVGELSALALLGGFAYLLFRKVVKPYITISILFAIVLISFIFNFIDPDRFTDPLFNLFSGGIILASCFMATDYVTSPMSTKAGIVYGVSIAFITMMIRYFASYPEGISFAILIMNAFVPLLDKIFHQKKYGRK